MSCYTQSDRMKTNLKKNSLKVVKMKKQGLIKPKKRMTRECVTCGDKFFTKPSRGTKNRFCSRPCFREFLSKRFDCWIANPETIKLPQNFDEFLTKTELPCLIKDCEWKGENLSGHVNMKHGITADEFKELAGFNKTTGLVVPELSKRISKWIKQGIEDGDITPQTFTADTRPEQPRREPLRPEGKEHWKKAMALTEASFTPKQKQCLECESSFLVGFRKHSQKYCSVKCRSNYYRRNK